MICAWRRYTVSLLLFFSSVNTMINCNWCRKPFRCQSALDIHSVVHTGITITAHHCILCDKLFNRKSSLWRHLFVVHSPRRPYACDTCGRSFTGMGALKRHVLIHSDLKRFACDVCDRAFLRIDCLKEHKRIHSGIKPFKCTICDKPFRQRHSVRVHENTTHTGARPHKCKVCGMDFSTRSNLTRHTKSKHWHWHTTYCSC